MKIFVKVIVMALVTLVVVVFLGLLMSSCSTVLPPAEKAKSAEHYCSQARELAIAVQFERAKGLPRKAIYFVPQNQLPEKEIERIETVIDWVYEGVSVEQVEERCLSEWGANWSIQM